jgi:hypothetical protein
MLLRTNSASRQHSSSTATTAQTRAALLNFAFRSVGSVVTLPGEPDKEVDPLRPLIVAIIALAVLVTIVSLWEIWHAEIAVP